MALLASACYDPSTAATAATSSLLALTALDTTNLRLTFTAPASGNVLVRIRVPVAGNATSPMLLFGVLEGSTVIARQAPMSGAGASATSTRNTLESSFVVTGVSAGSHTWDAAYAVQVVQTSSALKWGGPNNTTTDDAWGGAVFEVWEAANLLAAANYDPATAASKATSAALAMTAFDTTNLRCTFTAPASGNVWVRFRCVATGSSTAAAPLFGVLEGATVVSRGSPVGGRTELAALDATGFIVYEHAGIVSGVSAGSHSYDAAFGNEVATASTTLKYGGPNDALGGDAWGQADFEVWAA